MATADESERVKVKVGFTGTQVGCTTIQLESLERILLELKPTDFHHGDCIGADSQAHDIVRRMLCHIHIHPPIIPDKRAFREGKYIYRPKDYLTRNKHIVDACYVLVATPKEEYGETVRSGTWSTVRYARRLERDIIIIRPNGRVQRESK